MAISDMVAQDQLRAFIERIERLEEERKAIASDIAEVYAEAKGNGFDRKAVKAVVRIRSMDADVRMEHEALVALYLSALGMAAPEFEDDEQASHVHVHMHPREELPPHDAETGEIIEPVQKMHQLEDTAETPNEAALAPVKAGTARQAGEEVRASSAANSEPQPTAAQTGGPETPTPPSVAGPEAVESPAINSEAGIPVSASEPPAGAPGRIGVMPPNHDPDPVQFDRTKPAPWCADPEDCGVEASWNHTCGSCLRRRAQGDVMRAVQ